MKSACLDASDDSGPQGLVGRSRPAWLAGFARWQEKREPVVIGVFKSELHIGVHPALQHGDGVFARLGNDRRGRFHQGVKALLPETRKDLIFVPEMPVDGRGRIADLPRQPAQRKALIPFMDKAGARRVEDQRPDFRLVSRAQLKGIHVNNVHYSDRCSHLPREHADSAPGIWRTFFVFFFGTQSRGCRIHSDALRQTVFDFWRSFRGQRSWVQ